MSSFEHLDDAQPPSLDDDRWKRIRGRSRELARRRRVAVTTVSATAVIALILGAAGLAFVGRNQPGPRVVTVGVSTTSSEPSARVTVRLEVDHTVVNQGQDVTGTLVFDNHGGLVALPPARAAWRVVVGSGSSRPTVEWGHYLGTSGGLVILRPGITRSAFRAPTGQQSAECLGDDSVLACAASLPAGPARVWFVTNTTSVRLAGPASVAITITGRGERPPRPQPCPVPSPEPSMVTGQYCGPDPTPGNGLGPNGECTGHETTVPSAAGVVPGRYYTFTLPGRCDGVIIFDGRRWISQLPPPTDVPDFDVWMRLEPNGHLGFIGPNGTVGFDLDTGQAPGACRG